MGVDCEDIEGYKIDQDNVCVMLRPGNEKWSWQALNPLLVPIFELDPDGAGPLPVDLPDNEHTWVQALRETPVLNPAKIEATMQVAGVGALKATCMVEVEFEGPYVTQYWPNCGSACINAEVGARFSRLMNTEGDPADAKYAFSVRNKNNVKMYACGADFKCVDKMRMHNMNADVIFRTGAGTCGNKAIDADEQCDDGTQCDNGKDCTGAPGNCAGIGSGKCLVRSNDGCSDRCLLEGSSFKYGSVCGNGVTEKGENCDDGNKASGDGCSSDCLSEGIQPPGALPVTENTTEIAMQIPPTYNFGYLIPGVYYRVVLNGVNVQPASKAMRVRVWSA
jgi:cysteine-rich repeat protein